jgi:hypothetical protein
MTILLEEKSGVADMDRGRTVALRCSEPFKDHLEAIAAAETRTSTLLIERALREYAERHGHAPFPKR